MITTSATSYNWKKKTLFLMKSCTEHYIVTDVVQSDEGCAPKVMQYKNSYCTILNFGNLRALRLDLTQI
jgi:hypothetical protein